MANENKGSPQLNANMLWQNPKAAKAKQLLLEACAEESQKRTGIRPASAPKVNLNLFGAHAFIYDISLRKINDSIT